MYSRYLNAVHSELQNKLGLAPVEYIAEWAIEINASSRTALISMKGGPKHIFGDIREFVPDNLRKAVGLDGGIEWPAERLRKVLPKCKIKTVAPCFKCSGKLCQLTRTDEHTAGSPCQDMSKANRNAMRFEGPNAKLYYVWVAICRYFMFKSISHENVTQFGEEETKEHLGDISPYI
jgi:site-specific DNA-cytosine methylase